MDRKEELEALINKSLSKIKYHTGPSVIDAEDTIKNLTKYLKSLEDYYNEYKQLN